MDEVWRGSRGGDPDDGGCGVITDETRRWLYDLSPWIVWVVILVGWLCVGLFLAQ
jgi:hypothetical protein